MAGIVWGSVQLNDTGQVKMVGKQKHLASLSDLDGNGIEDVVVHMELENLNLAKGLSDVVLTGELGGEGPVGESFQGTDTVNVVRENCTQ